MMYGCCFSVVQFFAMVSSQASSVSECTFVFHQQEQVSGMVARECMFDVSSGQM